MFKLKNVVIAIRFIISFHNTSPVQLTHFRIVLPQETVDTGWKKKKKMKIRRILYFLCALVRRAGLVRHRAVECKSEVWGEPARDVTQGLNFSSRATIFFCCWILVKQIECFRSLRLLWPTCTFRVMFKLGAGVYHTRWATKKRQREKTGDESDAVVIDLEVEFTTLPYMELFFLLAFSLFYGPVTGS